MGAEFNRIYIYKIECEFVYVCVCVSVCSTLQNLYFKLIFKKYYFVLFHLVEKIPGSVLVKTELIYLL